MSTHPKPIDHQHYDYETANSSYTFSFTTLDEAREAARQLAGPNAQIVHRYLKQQHMKQQEFQPTTQDPRPTTLAAPVVASDELRQIGHRLRTQDNRCTADPIFQVRGKERIYGLDRSLIAQAVWKDDEWNTVEIPEDADPDEPPRGLTVVRYITIWRVLMVAFTEEGCKEHLRLNGHNYRHFDEVDIYADSLNRCPEMIAIREFLMKLPAPQAREGEGND